jgi:hypothetical protein
MASGVVVIRVNEKHKLAFRRKLLPRQIIWKEFMREESNFFGNPLRILYGTSAFLSFRRGVLNDD